MSRMLNLANRLELPDDCLDKAPLASQKLIPFEHQSILHIATGLGEELDAMTLP